ELKVSQSVISRLQQRNRKTGRVTEMHRSGCPLATSHADDRFIVNSALRNRMMNAILQTRLREVRGTRVSCQTCLRARRPTPPGTGVRHRLAWAREHLCLTRNQWASVLFSDESRFTLSRNDGRQFIVCNTGLISSSSTTMPQLIEAASSGNGCWRLAYLKWRGLHFLQT
uniref:Transposase Tc1-like domain-containing protein n=1 Tax=Sinocyclocheilus rhinocerous TaxID=307959 RepID=A0A673LUM0_9TELE